MLGKIDKWICESLLYIDFKQKEKGQDELFRFALLLVLSSTVFLNIISVDFILHFFGVPELIPLPTIPLSLSSITLLFLYVKYHNKDNYIAISNKLGFRKKLWGTAVIYTISSFTLMWTSIIYAVLTER
jgi:hypothetical protein